MLTQFLLFCLVSLFGVIQGGLMGGPAFYNGQPYHGGYNLHSGYYGPYYPGYFPYQHPMYPPSGTYYDQHSASLRPLPGGGMPVLVDYQKRCAGNYVGVQSHPDQRQYYYVCNPDGVVFSKCGNLQTFDSNAGKCRTPSTGQPQFTCIKEGNYPIRGDCTIYYKCDCTLTPRIYSCPRGKIFSTVTKECVTGNQCIPTQISTDATNLPENCEDKFPSCLEQGVFRSPSDCSLYFECALQANGTFLQTRFKCPGDNFFDVNKKLCLPQNQVACDCIQIAELVYPKPNFSGYYMQPVSPNLYPAHSQTKYPVEDSQSYETHTESSEASVETIDSMETTISPSSTTIEEHGASSSLEEENNSDPETTTAATAAPEEETTSQQDTTKHIEETTTSSEDTTTLTDNTSGSTPKETTVQTETSTTTKKETDSPSKDTTTLSPEHTTTSNDDTTTTTETTTSSDETTLPGDDDDEIGVLSSGMKAPKKPKNPKKDDESSASDESLASEESSESSISAESLGKSTLKSNSTQTNTPTTLTEHTTPLITLGVKEHELNFETTKPLSSTSMQTPSSPVFTIKPKVTTSDQFKNTTATTPVTTTLSDEDYIVESSSSLSMTTIPIVENDIDEPKVLSDMIDFDEHIVTSSVILPNTVPSIQTSAKHKESTTKNFEEYFDDDTTQLTPKQSSFTTLAPPNSARVNNILLSTTSTKPIETTTLDAENTTLPNFSSSVAPLQSFSTEPKTSSTLTSASSISTAIIEQKPTTAVNKEEFSDNDSTFALPTPSPSIFSTSPASTKTALISHNTNTPINLHSTSNPTLLTVSSSNQATTESQDTAISEEEFYDYGITPTEQKSNKALPSTTLISSISHATTPSSSTTLAITPLQNEKTSSLPKVNSTPAPIILPDTLPPTLASIIQPTTKNTGTTIFREEEYYDYDTTIVTKSSTASSTTSLIVTPAMNITNKTTTIISNDSLIQDEDDETNVLSDMIDLSSNISTTGPITASTSTMSTAKTARETTIPIKIDHTTPKLGTTTASEEELYDYDTTISTPTSSPNKSSATTSSVTVFPSLATVSTSSLKPQLRTTTKQNSSTTTVLSSASATAQQISSALSEEEFYDYDTTVAEPTSIPNSSPTSTTPLVLPPPKTSSTLAPVITPNTISVSSQPAVGEHKGTAILSEEEFYDYDTTVATLTSSPSLAARITMTTPVSATKIQIAEIERMNLLNEDNNDETAVLSDMIDFGPKTTTSIPLLSSETTIASNNNSTTLATSVSTPSTILLIFNSTTPLTTNKNLQTMTGSDEEFYDYDTTIVTPNPNKQPLTNPPPLQKIARPNQNVTTVTEVPNSTPSTTIQTERITSTTSEEEFYDYDTTIVVPTTSHSKIVKPLTHSSPITRSSTSSPSPTITSLITVATKSLGSTTLGTEEFYDYDTTNFDATSKSTLATPSVLTGTEASLTTIETVTNQPKNKVTIPDIPKSGTTLEAKMSPEILNENDQDDTKVLSDMIDLDVITSTPNATSIATKTTSSPSPTLLKTLTAVSEKKKEKSETASLSTNPTTTTTKILETTTASDEEFYDYDTTVETPSFDPQHLFGTPPSITTSSSLLLTSSEASSKTQTKTTKKSSSVNPTTFTSSTASTMTTQKITPTVSGEEFYDYDTTIDDSISKMTPSSLVTVTFTKTISTPIESVTKPVTTESVPTPETTPQNKTPLNILNEHEEDETKVLSDIIDFDIITSTPMPITTSVTASTQSSLTLLTNSNTPSTSPATTTTQKLETTPVSGEEFYDYDTTIATSTSNAGVASQSSFTTTSQTALPTIQAEITTKETSKNPTFISKSPPNKITNDAVRDSGSEEEFYDYDTTTELPTPKRTTISSLPATTSIHTQAENIEVPHSLSIASTPISPNTISTPSTTTPKSHSTTVTQDATTFSEEEFYDYDTTTELPTPKRTTISSLPAATSIHTQSENIEVTHSLSIASIPISPNTISIPSTTPKSHSTTVTQDATTFSEEEFYDYDTTVRNPQSPTPLLTIPSSTIKVTSTKPLKSITSATDVSSPVTDSLNEDILNKNDEDETNVLSDFIDFRQITPIATPIPITTSAITTTHSALLLKTSSNTRSTTPTPTSTQKLETPPISDEEFYDYDTTIETPTTNTNVPTPSSFITTSSKALPTIQAKITTKETSEKPTKINTPPSNKTTTEAITDPASKEEFYDYDTTITEPTTTQPNIFSPSATSSTSLSTRPETGELPRSSLTSILPSSPNTMTLPPTSTPSSQSKIAPEDSTTFSEEEFYDYDTTVSSTQFRATPPSSLATTSFKTSSTIQVTSMKPSMSATTGTLTTSPRDETPLDILNKNDEEETRVLSDMIDFGKTTPASDEEFYDYDTTISTPKSDHDVTTPSSFITTSLKTLSTIPLEVTTKEAIQKQKPITDPASEEEFYDYDTTTVLPTRPSSSTSSSLNILSTPILTQSNTMQSSHSSSASIIPSSPNTISIPSIATSSIQSTTVPQDSTTFSEEEFYDYDTTLSSHTLQIAPSSVLTATSPKTSSIIKETTKQPSISIITSKGVPASENTLKTSDTVPTDILTENDEEQPKVLSNMIDVDGVTATTETIPSFTTNLSDNKETDNIISKHLPINTQTPPKPKLCTNSTTNTKNKIKSLEISFRNGVVKLRSNNLSENPVNNQNFNSAESEVHCHTSSRPRVVVNLMDDIDFVIKFCPPDCNEEHKHNYEKKNRAVDITYYENGSHKTIGVETGVKAEN